LIKKVTKILVIARLVPEAKFYLVRSARPTSGPILKVLKERAEELRNFHVETYMPGGYSGSELGAHEGLHQEIFVEALLLLQHIGDLYEKPPRLGDHIGH